MLYLHKKKAVIILKTGTANLPLHGGKCPAWLFAHMKTLSAAIIEVILEESGPEEVLQRLSDPYWFQALGCVVGFDWHSSGVTTTVCGALKEGLADIGPQAGLYIAGGKGRSSRNTPFEIKSYADKYPLAINAEKLIYASKMSAKVDSTAVQDGYQLYHHCFVFTGTGHWAVIQQGMNEGTAQARRYHWLSSAVKNFTAEPQAAICCDHTSDTLNLVSHDNQPLRQISYEMVHIPPDRLLAEISKISEPKPELHLPGRHTIPRTSYLNKALYAAYEQQPQDFEQLLQVPGLGPGTLRALCLVAEVAYGVEASYADPVRYSFAHGGKDGFPFPVNEADIENSYTVLNRALSKARAGRREQLQALNNLAKWHSEALPVSQHQCTPQPSAPNQTRRSGSPKPGTQTTSNLPFVQPSLFN
ncbi:Protein of unknown function DUF763 [Syntrophomonas zehnderi OL-4]|uniref:DUF763 domain-containing protein n=1 Tax=Syntrophomonas zehnderi OL-4 TaxID=690567 RepID=A0A0E4GF11_9FIRM|nr:Protein of unknown function DUF763 [Syntrophomonas zehnderi OL-4]